jgi:glycosyltransferase involved in cell wall biosynthesis
VHVCHVIEATIGGTRRHIVDLSRAQARRGHEVTLISSALRDPGYREDLALLAAEGVRCVDLPMTRSIRPHRDLAHLARLVGLLRELRPVLLHTHSSKAGVLGRLAAREVGLDATVHTPHTFAFLFADMFGPLRRGLYRGLEQQLAGSTARVVAVSTSEARTIRASGVVPPERLRVVPNGIDPAPWRAARPYARAELGVAEGAPLVLVAGLLNVAKGQDLALRALARPELAGVELLLAGHGEMLDELRALALELGVERRARFLGWRDDLPRLMAGADALLLPSRWEGLPYVVLQAFAAGVPVAAARVDGALELVEEGRTGALADVGDVPGLAAALARVLALGPAGRAELGRAGAERVEAGYTVERMAQGMDAVYREVA